MITKTDLMSIIRATETPMDLQVRLDMAGSRLFNYGGNIDIQTIGNLMFVYNTDEGLALYFMSLDQDVLYGLNEIKSGLSEEMILL